MRGSGPSMPRVAVNFGASSWPLLHMRLPSPIVARTENNMWRSSAPVAVSSTARSIAMHSRYSRYREFGLLALVLVVASLGAATAVQAQGFRDQYEGRKKILIVGDLRTGNQIAHDGVGHAMGVLEQLGRKSGAYVSFLRSDTDLVTKGEVWGKGDYAKGGRKQAPGRNLDYFDAVVFYTNGDLEMSDQQKQDLLDFVRKDGKGFVAIHTAAVTMTNFPEYGEMIGGFFVNHPWNVFDAPVVNERPDSPIAKHLPKEFLMRDEMYQYKDPYSRDKVDVLLRLDARHLDLDNKNVQRTDGDFPIAWTKTYGKGRVFTSSLGHSDASWDDPRLPVAGEDVLALGYAAGREVGRLLGAVEEWWAARDFAPDRAACLAELRRLTAR
ncbi:MAG: ThuA domain-containing protein [Gammaproteobacteria bacterium]|nr:ThuA domain-containing protein [Gammaproteobacteria bacterium]